MVLDYEPSAAYLSTALRWSYTVVPFVLSRKEFWAFMLLHLAIGQLYRDGYLLGADESNSLYFIDWNDMKVISAITTFFEVFYTNQTFSRYQHLYSTTRKLLGTVTAFCFEVSLLMKSSSKQHVRLSSRFFILSVVLFFLEMKNDSSEREWEELIDLGLVKKMEKEHLEQYHKQQRSLMLLHWSAKVVRDGHSIAVKDKKAPANSLKGLVDKLVDARQCMQEIIDTLCLPLPFQYFHLLNVMIVVNLLLWAYGMGITHSMFAPVVFFFAALIFMGMMELASQLSDPFGDDDTDFPVAKWIAETLEDAAVVLEYRYAAEDDDDWKTALAEEDLPTNIFETADRNRGSR